MITSHQFRRPALGILAAVTALVTLGAPPAAAEVVDQRAFHDELSFTDDDFCDVGLTVDVAVTIDGRYRVTARRTGGFGYYLETTTVVQVFTDRASGHTATDLQPRTLTKDLALTDNGDGTLTAIVLLTGGARTYGHAGTLIAKNSGQVRLRIVYDHVNDVELTSAVIFGSTGTNDDFCAAVLADWRYR